jgi:hypothetical protein
VQTADRPLFEDQLGALCAGFNVPMTELRTDAYWRGLQKMHLVQFARVVEYALSERGPERIPTVPQCWALLKQQRATRPADVIQPVATATYDALHCFAQRCLLRWLRENGPVPAEALQRIVSEKNRLLDQFRVIATEERLVADDVRPAMFRGFDQQVRAT